MLCRYIKNHHLHKLNDNPNFDYLGHPVNAYHFIRHVASGWKRILNDGPKINIWIENNVGQIIWNNFPGDIGNLKTSFIIRRQLLIQCIFITFMKIYHYSTTEASAK